MKAGKNVLHDGIDWERVFDAIPEMVAVIDTGHKILWANKAMSAKLGSTQQELSGRPCYEVLHGLSSAPDFCPHARTLLTGKEESEVVVEPRLGGTFDITSTPLYDRDGTLTGSVHLARDITARTKREQLMLENLALSEFSLNHSMDEILTLTIDKAELLTGSRIGFFHFLDDDGSTISNQTWSTNTKDTFCTADKTPRHYPVEEAGVWTDCLREGRPVIHNDYAGLPHRKGLPEGHASVIRELTVPVMRDGKVVAILGVGNKPSDYDQQDVEIVSHLTNLAYEFAESRRFEEALHKSEQYARALLDAIPDLIFRMNRDGVYLDYKAMKEDLYFQSSSIIGKNNRDLTPPDFASLVEEKIRTTLEHGTMEVFEYQLVVPGKGLRFFEARMVPSGPDEVTTISRDITERKKTDSALKKKIEELEWFNHMMIDRELKMIELKQEINELLLKSGREEKYPIHK